MPFLILSVLLQVALVIHIIKTGRNTTWIWVVMMLPLAGSIAYFALEVLPGLANSKGGRKAQRDLKQAIDPNRAAREALQAYQRSDTVQNAVNLAEQLLRQDEYGQVQDILKPCLRGAHNDDAMILFHLAAAAFGLSDYAECKILLDRLIEKNPDFQNPEAHLLYARGLESLGDSDGAGHEFEALHQYFSGPKASYYYAMFNRTLGRDGLAQTLLDEIAHDAIKANAHYRDIHREWIKKAAAANR